MKKFLILGFLIAIALTSVNAQGLYFDAGIGVGLPTTKLSGTKVSFSSANFTEIGYDLGLKVGFGPIVGLPLYAVGAFGFTGHRFSDSANDHITFNSFLLGGGVIFYPIPLIQVAGSIGYSFVANDTSIPGFTFYKSEGGFAYEVSVAADLGFGNSGILLGAKYFGAINTLETSKVKQDQSYIGVFVRYALRNK
ncbi:MAG: porin family protein [Treponema sp.]|nr:porin family protein [Treponema sp.]MCL2250856.1 porin family protein [Treponema sp.]